MFCSVLMPQSFGAPTGAPEAKSTCVASPFGLTEPLSFALVEVMLVAESVVAVGGLVVVPVGYVRVTVPLAVPLPKFTIDIRQSVPLLKSADVTV